MNDKKDNGTIASYMLFYSNVHLSTIMVLEMKEINYIDWQQWSTFIHHVLEAP